MKIVTHYSDVAPRRYAWHAIDDETYDGGAPGTRAGAIGLGHTPGAAIADLLEQLAEQEPAGE